MLFQEEAIESVLVAAGQTLVTPEQLGLAGDRISRAIFVPAVHEYAKYRPPTKTVNFEIVGSAAWTLPTDFRAIIAIKPNWYSTSYALGAPSFISTPLWSDQLEVQNNTLIGPPGIFRLEYMAKTFTLTTDHPNYLLELQRSGSGNTYTAKLPTEIQPNTLTLYFESAEAEDDGNGVIVGSFVNTGSINYGSRTITLNTFSDLGPGIVVDFRSKYPGVKELDLTHSMFLDLLTVKLGISIGHIKAQMQIEGMEININNDDFLSYAKEREVRFKESLDSKQSWWLGVGA